MSRAAADRSAGERLVAVEQRLTDHEARCEERLTEIKLSASQTLTAVEGLKKRLWGISLALLAWALAQVWAASQARLAQLEAPHAASLPEASDLSGGSISLGKVAQ
jgi:hypothetical protein